ncbi:MAG: hypothetical protein ACK4SY_06725 [Pyrobaculum sp.]
MNPVVAIFAIIAISVMAFFIAQFIGQMALPQKVHPALGQSLELVKTLQRFLSNPSNIIVLAVFGIVVVLVWRR